MAKPSIDRKPRSPATFTTRSGRVLLKPPGGGTINRMELRRLIRAVRLEREQNDLKDVAELA